MEWIDGVSAKVARAQAGGIGIDRTAAPASPQHGAYDLRIPSSASLRQWTRLPVMDIVPSGCANGAEPQRANVPVASAC